MLAKRFFTYFEEIVGGICISITVLLVIINVFLRYGFGLMLGWGEEVATICFTWSVFVGASACYKHKLHIGVDIITQMFNKRIQRFIEILIFLIMIAINITIVILGISYLISSDKTTPVMGVSYVWVNSSLVVGFVFMTYHTVKGLIFNLLSIDKGKDPEEDFEGVI
jgi:TRAP-type transport system small permease protein